MPPPATPPPHERTTPRGWHRCSTSCTTRGQPNWPLTGRWQHLHQLLHRAQAQADWWTHCQQTLAPLEAARETARAAAQHTEHAAAGCAAILTARAEHHATALRHAWDAQLAEADQAARTIAHGPGRLGVHRGRVRDAHQHLDTWANQWTPVLAASDLDPQHTRHWPAAYPFNIPRIADALDQHARQLATAEHPDHTARINAAHEAGKHYQAAADAYHHARRQLEQISYEPLYDTSAADLIPELTDHLHAAQHRAATLDQNVAGLAADPAILGQPEPDALLHTARAAWRADRIAAQQQLVVGSTDPTRSLHRHPEPTPEIEHGPSISR